jgi:hypothetical protein
LLKNLDSTKKKKIIVKAESKKFTEQQQKSHANGPDPTIKK